MRVMYTHFHFEKFLHCQKHTLKVNNWNLRAILSFGEIRPTCQEDTRTKKFTAASKKQTLDNHSDR